MINAHTRVWLVLPLTLGERRPDAINRDEWTHSCAKGTLQSIKKRSCCRFTRCRKVTPSELDKGAYNLNTRGFQRPGVIPRSSSTDRNRF